MRKRYALLTSLVGCVFALALASVAGATYWVTYGGPKTWLPNYAAASNYDTAGDRWGWNEFANRSVDSYAQITFIDGNGSWHYTLNCYGTYCGRRAENPAFFKKCYCKNTDTISYTGRCNGERGY